MNNNFFVKYKIIFSKPNMTAAKNTGDQHVYVKFQGIPQVKSIINYNNNLECSVRTLQSEHR